MGTENVDVLSIHNKLAGDGNTLRSEGKLKLIIRSKSFHKRDGGRTQGGDCKASTLRTTGGSGPCSF